MMNERSDCTIKNTSVISPIAAGNDGDYVLLNGLVDVNLFVLINLLKVIDEDLKIKNIIGMAGVFYNWCKHPIFKIVRNSRLSNRFRLNPEGKCTLTPILGGILCESFTSDWRSFFLSTLLSHGIFHWTVRISYKNRSTFLIGAAPPFQLAKLNSRFFTYTIKGSCGFGFRSSSITDTFLNGTKTFPPSSVVKVEDNSLVAEEANLDARTLCFFVNGTKVSFGVCGVHVPLHLGVVGNNNAIFTSVSCRRISVPTPSSVVCQFHQSE